MRVATFAQLLLIVLWLGAGATILLIGAPAAFAGSPDRSAAGNVVSFMLRRWHYLSVLIPAVLLLLELKGGLQHTARMLLLIGAIVLGAAQVMVDARIHRMRSDSLTPVSELAPNDPYRRQFGLLHGVSSMVMLLQIIAAAGVLWTLSGAPAGLTPPTSTEKAREIEL